VLRACLVIAAGFAVCAWGAPPLAIDYPPEGAVFPPDFAPPTFLWRDTSAATGWRIDVAFSSSGAPLRYTSAGPRARVGEIDPDCVSTTNRPPTVDARQRTWRPAAATWRAIEERAARQPVAVTITGIAGARAVSKATLRIEFSPDPVDAPIFYRDVPLMPTETEPGVIKPLAPYAVRLVKWRLRDVRQSASRVVMEKMPMCANCHSFSRDGKFMGMDLDGLRNNRGQYFLAGVQPQIEVRNQDVLQWSTAEGPLRSPVRVGFMSQVSPDGSTVATTIDTPGASDSNYYVANFTDYRFLQVFFPTRGRLAWYDRARGVLQALPGADDPAFVHFGAVWSPDGESLVFARAPAQNPRPPGARPARFANDPNELQIRYDLCRIAFRHGKGGRAEPIRGASQNGMSNTFPKLSPDGRWLVFVQSRNGQLMRPDSQLYIVPAAGGEARRMRCNTPRMNSWHSFSPNGRWLVFSSKARSPYTQMYLTHIDAAGNDTPAILIENATAANRAVNLPEFVNVAADGLRAIGGPALDFYRLYDRALYLQKERRYDESAEKWKAALALREGDADVRRRLGMTLLLAGRRAEALPYLEQTRPAKENRLESAIHMLEQGREAGTVEIADPPGPREHYYLALASLRSGRAGDALDHLRRSISLDPKSPDAHARLAEMLGKGPEALEHWRAVIELRANHAGALRGAAWILATDTSLHNGEEALALAARAAMLSKPDDVETLATLAAAYAEKARFADAVATAQRALADAPPARRRALERQLEQYRRSSPWRE
jgi:tetratricopeptide (TPR) repeat protein